MKFTYEKPLDKEGNEREDVIVRSDGAWIPCDPSNSDYQRYLRWLEDPNADEFQPPLEG